MRLAKPGVFVAAGLLAGCAPQMTSTTDTPNPRAADSRTAATPVEPRIVPIPPIPAALRGCWETDGPEDPEEPGGPHRLVVGETTVEEHWPGQPVRVASAEYVQRVSDTSIEGLFSAPDGHGHRATVATSLELGNGVDWPRDMLRRAEGDAGSDIYRRCAK